MEKRAAIPVLPPRAKPTVSYWQDPPDTTLADYLSSKAVPETADTVIIGSGISGSSIAYNLLTSSKPAGKVVLLEARQACSGATGRNGGHTKAGSYRTFLSNSTTHSLHTAAQIARFEYLTIKSLHAFAREHDIPCDLFSGDTVDVIYDAAQWAQAQSSVKAMREAMPKDLDGAARYELWSSEEAREKFFVRGEECVGAISYEAGSLSAYKFVIGLLKLALKHGLELYTNTPVAKISKDEDGSWSVQTKKGTVKAKRVVLATNGYTAALWKEFQGKLVPMRGQITAHRPGSKMPKEGLGVTYSFIYANGYEYMIPRPPGSKFEGDIVIGGGLVQAPDEGLEEFGTVDDTVSNPIISKYLTATTERYFGDAWGEDDTEGRVRREWSGIMGFSGDGFPFVGSVPGQEGLWVSASFQGHGMVLCWLCGKALAEMINGEEEGLEEWFPDAFRVTKERMEIPFMGRLHLKPLKQGGEEKH